MGRLLPLGGERSKPATDLTEDTSSGAEVSKRWPMDQIPAWIYFIWTHTICGRYNKLPTIKTDFMQKPEILLLTSQQPELHSHTAMVGWHQAEVVPEGMGFPAPQSPPFLIAPLPASPTC